MFQNIIDSRKVDLEKVFQYFKEEVSGIRTGRASLSMVENLRVEAYNSEMSLKELAALSIPEPRTIQIQPWDKTVLPAIEKAIENSELGLNPSVDGNVVRLVIPSLTEERRKEFTKLLHQKVEEARIKVRRIRDEIMHKVQEMEKTGEVREDEKFKAKDNVQKIVDNFNKKIDDIRDAKEKELMQV